MLTRKTGWGFTPKDSWRLSGGVFLIPIPSRILNPEVSCTYYLDRNGDGSVNELYIKCVHSLSEEGSDGRDSETD